MEKSINSLLACCVFSIDSWAVHVSYSHNVSFDMSAKQRLWGWGLESWLFRKCCSCCDFHGKTSSVYYPFASVPLLSIGWLKKWHNLCSQFSFLLLNLFFTLFWPENRKKYLISSKEAKCEFKAIVKHYKMWSKPVLEKCLWIETSWGGCTDCSGIGWGYLRSDHCSEQCCLHHFRIIFLVLYPVC